MIVVRLSRGGSKNHRFFNINVADSRMPNTGRFIEQVGFFNPDACGQEERVRINLERLEYWLGEGAQMSSTVAQLVKDYQQELKQENVSKDVEQQVA